MIDNRNNSTNRSRTDKIMKTGLKHNNYNTESRLAWGVFFVRSFGETIQDLSIQLGAADLYEKDFDAKQPLTLNPKP